jgi:dienelactone hydrolase
VPSGPIAVERISGPILTAGAGDDAVWQSTTYTQQIQQRLDAHHFRYPHQRLTYPQAGHDIGAAIPYLPEPDQAHFGGSPQASAAARADLWPRILDFLKRLGAGR